MRKTALTLAMQAALGLSATVAVSPAAFGADEPIREEIIVTGSRIQKANVVSSSPVTQIDSDEFLFTGITRAEDLVKNLPQVYVEQNTGTSNGSTGTASFNLRSLGAERTLVLVDGRRLPAGSPLQGGEAPDINQIPGALIERVEVLTGGASSTYGSDAVAGVVNFIMKDDFEGVAFDYQFSQYSHSNDDGGMERIIAARGFQVPSGRKNDGDIDSMSLIIGSNLADDRGNITAYATYRDIKAVNQGQRDYSGCALDATASVCAGSGTSPKGRFLVLGPTQNFRVEGSQFVLGREDYNFGPLNFFQRPDIRYTGGVIASYDVAPFAKVYGNIMVMDDQSVSQIAPSGSFGVFAPIGCDNPFLSAQQVQVVCTARGLAATDSADTFIFRRNVEGGPRQQDLRHTSFRGVFGVTGDVTETWRYDASAQYSEVSMENTYLNDLSNTRIPRALDATRDANGNIVCQAALDGIDSTCVPWNVFTTGGVTEAAINYLTLPLFARGTTEQKVVTGYVEGALGNYGVKLPWAESGIVVVAGLEFRDEALDFSPDSGFQTGDGAGQGGPTLPTNGDYQVTDYFAEAAVPIVEGQPWAEAITLDLGYRYSDYSTGQESDTYKFAGSWDFPFGLRLRGSYQRAVRAANLRELFLPQGTNLFDIAADPCAGPVNAQGRTPEGRTLAECMRSGVTAAQFGTEELNSPAGQYNFLQGGNPNLEPEVSDTNSLGVVYQPHFVDGLTLSLDYFDIEVEKAIDNLDPGFILDSCLDGDLARCAAVQRDPRLGTLWITGGQIVATNTNIGFFSTDGYDFVADYTLTIDDVGTFSLQNNLTYIDSWEQQELEGAAVQSCEGLWGDLCGFPTVELKNQMRVTWVSPWVAPFRVTVSGLWRYIDEVGDLSGSGADLSDTNYFDLAAIWEPVEWATIRGGVNNLLDEAPPIAGGNAGPSFFGNGNVFPGLYDALGRYFFIGAEVHLN